MDRIWSWLDTIPATEPWCESRKRKRGQQTVQVESEPALPSPTMSNLPDEDGAAPLQPLRSVSPSKRQRIADDHGIYDDNATPRPSVTRRVPSFAPLTQRSNRSRSSSPVKTAQDLQTLAKPVVVRALPLRPSEVLPSTIYALYKKVQAFAGREGIMPREIRPALEQMMGEDLVLDRWFCDAVPAKEPDAPQELNEMKRIVEQTALSSDDYEDGRGFWVYFPMLRLVFGDQQDPDTQPDEHAVVPEAIAFAGMVKACVPQLAPDANGLYACSYNESSASGLSSGTGTWNSARELANSGKPGGGRKVDYALVLQCRRDSQLHRAIAQACFSLQSQIGGKRHVNQTDYQKIQFKPIAVAIEAKRITAGGDRVVQLGLWTAAWHTRMEQFRMLHAQPNPGSDAAGDGGWIVPLPMIAIDGSVWNLYFACDVGTAIHMYGPIAIGDTSNVVNAYILLSCLRALKEWVRGPFLDWVRSFFLGLRDAHRV